MDPSRELPPGLLRWLAERGGGASRGQLLARGSTSVDLAGELLLDAVPPPACNLPLRMGGREIRPDLLWLELGIAVEVDGRGKYDEPEVLWREKRRQEWMESELGLIVLRFTNAEIGGDPRECSRRWRAAQARRGVMPWERPPGLEVKVRGSR